MTAKDLINKIVKIGKKEMEGLFYSDKNKEKVILHEISIKCKVAPKTVRNWRSGGHIGELRKEKLEAYYKEVKSRYESKRVSRKTSPVS